MVLKLKFSIEQTDAKLRVKETFLHVDKRKQRLHVQVNSQIEFKLNFHIVGSEKMKQNIIIFRICNIT